MERQQRKPALELISPAGGPEKMKTALIHGAGAVYLGIPDFSLRARVNEFDLVKIRQAARYCRDNNKRIYAAINIFAHNHHIKKLPPYIKELKKARVDALIISDPGVLESVKEIWPRAEIHLSTQMNCLNYGSAAFWQKQGVKRIILGREASLEDIRGIKKRLPGLELEYFLHGAMCVAYSGRCFLSRYFKQRSANLGDCVQPCRWEFKIKSARLAAGRQNREKTKDIRIIEDDKGSYLLNSRDLCLIKHIKDLARAGITGFKIEGRAKSVYYQAVTAGIYSRVLNDIDDIKEKEIDRLYKDLSKKLVNRGYTSGFLKGEKAGQNLEEARRENDWEFCGQVLDRAPPNARRLTGAYVKIHNSLKAGDEIEIVKPGYDIMKMKVKELYDEESNEKIKEAHGGQNRIIYIKTDKNVPEYSVIRRKIG